jgi:hypothetical protein
MRAKPSSDLVRQHPPYPTGTGQEIAVVEWPAQAVVTRFTRPIARKGPTMDHVVWDRVRPERTTLGRRGRLP